MEGFIFIILAIALFYGMFWFVNNGPGDPNKMSLQGEDRYCEMCGHKLKKTKTYGAYNSDTGKRTVIYEYKCTNKGLNPFHREYIGWG